MRGAVQAVMARTRSASVAFAASLSSCVASWFSWSRRAVAVARSAASMQRRSPSCVLRGSPLLRTSWSRYERTTGNAAGHTSCGCACGLYSSMTDELRGVDLVLRQVLARRELEHVEAARQLGRVDVAVVPVRAPGAADDEVLGIDRAAIEVRDLDRVVGSVKSKTLTPPWYQPCTMMSRPGTGMSPPLCDTQFSVSVCAASILK
jgi:hypothetical protein